MLSLRSLAFNIAFYLWTAIVAIPALPILLLPPEATYRLSRLWGRGVMWLAAHIVGLTYEIRGCEHVPAGPVIYAFKHQSAFETLLFAILIPRFGGVFKRELLWLPFVGWYMWRARMIPIDRAAGAAALRRMLARAREVVAEGRSIVVMPEGTRTAPGTHRPYHPGVAALYRDLGLPVVPVALNSGMFWARRAFIKRPGRIALEFLEPIAPGLDRKRFMAELETRIETASERLRKEAAVQLGHTAA
jgi:1-acyl-sn-glycerol-3-phosphate acyltransferase